MSMLRRIQRHDKAMKAYSLVDFVYRQVSSINCVTSLCIASSFAIATNNYNSLSVANHSLTLKAIWQPSRHNVTSSTLQWRETIQRCQYTTRMLQKDQMFSLRPVCTHKMRNTMSAAMMMSYGWENRFRFWSRATLSCYDNEHYFWNTNNGRSFIPIINDKCKIN